MHLPMRIQDLAMYWQLLTTWVEETTILYCMDCHGNVLSRSTVLYDTTCSFSPPFSRSFLFCYCSFPILYLNQHADLRSLTSNLRVENTRPDRSQRASKRVPVGEIVQTARVGVGVGLGSPEPMRCKVSLGLDRRSLSRCLYPS
jgi:hypothetical protein